MDIWLPQNNYLKKASCLSLTQVTKEGTGIPSLIRLTPPSTPEQSPRSLGACPNGQPAEQALPCQQNAMTFSSIAKGHRVGRHRPALTRFLPAGTMKHLTLPPAWSDPTYFYFFPFPAFFQGEMWLSWLHIHSRRSSTSSARGHSRSCPCPAPPFVPWNWWI